MAASRVMSLFVEHRTVLDIGAGSGINRPDWMHALVASVAEEAVGIEIDGGLGGGRGRWASTWSPPTRRRWAAPHLRGLWAGELIEHLVVFGRFPRRGAPAPGTGGLLVLTTPNAFAVCTSSTGSADVPVNKGIILFDEHLVSCSGATATRSSRCRTAPPTPGAIGCFSPPGGISRENTLLVRWRRCRDKTPSAGVRDRRSAVAHAGDHRATRAACDKVGAAGPRCRAGRCRSRGTVLLCRGRAAGN